MIKPLTTKPTLFFLISVLLINTPVLVFANSEQTSIYLLSQQYSSNAKPINPSLNFFQDLTTNNQNLSLIRIGGPAYSALPGTLGVGWRTNFDFALLKTAKQYQVIHPDGSVNVFTVSGDSLRSHTSGTRLLFTEKNTQMQFQNNTGLIVTFHGSYPIVIQRKNNPSIQLIYEGKRLKKVTSLEGDAIVFQYKNNGQIYASNGHGDRVLYQTNKDAYLNRITKTSKGRESASTSIDIDKSLWHCPTQTANKNALCQNNQTTYKPYQFLDALSIPFAQQMDIRPSSCSSFFDEYASTERGFNIENGFSTFKPYAAELQTVKNFPVIDFLSNGEAKIMTSRNLLATSYGENGQANALYKKLLQNAEAITTKLVKPLTTLGFVTASANGQTTTLYPSDVQNLVLELVIQHGVASPDQIAQIQRAKIQLLKQYGITLKVIEIP